jgi:uncharacterized membrane protein YkvA (DUF1232 family)
MNSRKSTGGSRCKAPDTGLLIDLLRQIKLIWRLLKDRRVPLWMKAIPFLSLGYLLVPTDLVPDVLLGLGQLDDMAVLALGAKLFTELVPEEVVQEHREELAAEEHGWTVVEGEAEQLDDSQP